MSKFDYYGTICTSLLENYPPFQKLCENTCRTTWSNGEPFTLQQDCCYKALLEIDKLMELGLIPNSSE